ncbi:EamA family transporter [Daejeonella sp. JGW-45]|uniref:EamA family transporter n=1 Tax=Daejeonella sp. JGW-45 TaxID=3034148 RepID=UPI0023EAFD4D|nr:EamA family transporter [Daejeonella sp. JGW-45]
MTATASKSASPVMVIFAFAIVYIVWGSTYFFIQMAVADFPPFLLGALRFLLAGIFMTAWCVIKGEKLFGIPNIKHAVISGILLLFVGNGIIIWVEQTVPSGLASITVSSAPLWFVLLDQPKWSENFRSRSIILGMIIGLAGVIMLFSEQVSASLEGSGGVEMGTMALLILASIAWAAGSLYSKYKSSQGSTMVNTSWQMMAAGIAFLPGVFVRGELNGFAWGDVSADAWLALLYLVFLGSIAGFSAYVWLLKVRPAMQVSTYAYVNPVVAVLLAVFFANENITLIQILGLVIILGSVLLINMAKYRREKTAALTKPDTIAN